MNILITLFMSQVVTITRQGQLTIPRAMRKHFRMEGSTKALLRLEGQTMIVEPKAGFWSLSGSLGSNVKHSDAELRRARKNFEKRWARKV